MGLVWGSRFGVQGSGFVGFIEFIVFVGIENPGVRSQHSGERSACGSIVLESMERGDTSLLAPES
jgi:hypothetical protein